MNRPLRCLLLLATLVGGLALVGAVQEPAGTKKSDSKQGEPTKAGEPAKGKGKDGSKPAADMPKLPPGSVLIVPKDFEKGWPVWPGIILMPLDEYLKLKAAADKRQAKAEKTLASECELVGRLEGDFLTLRAEYTFTTEVAKTTVILGLQGAQLTERAELNGQAALLDYNADDGFTARVEEPAAFHRLVLHLRVPVVSKRPAGGNGLERTLEVGLPGLAIGRLALELPAAVKEVRCNNELFKKQPQSKWLFDVSKKQALSVVWREPAPQLGGGPHLSVDGKIKVDLAGTVVTVSAELILEDPRGQTKECQLALPPQVDAKDVKVEAPPGVRYELIPPEPKNPNYVLRFVEPNAEPWKVTAFVRLPQPAPGGRLPVGPFYVYGAEHQRGTITIVAAAELQRKQRLIVHPQGDVRQRDPPKGQDIEAVFQYWSMPNPSKAKTPAGARVPLELEIKSERGPLDVAMAQTLKLRSNGEGWEIDLTAQLNLKSPYGGGDFVDLQLPKPRPQGASAFAVAPAVPFPAALPWPALGLMRGPALAWAIPGDFQITDKDDRVLDAPPPDAHGRCRVPLPRGLGKEFALKVRGTYSVAPQSQRVRVGLPHALGLTEQGSKVTMLADEAFELLTGPRGMETPVPQRHRYQLDVDETPLFLDLAWRPYQPVFPVDSLIDVVIRARSAQVRQRLTFGPPPRPGAGQPIQPGQVELQVPTAVKGLTQIQNNERIALRPEKGIVSVISRGEEQKEVVLEYDLPLAGGPIGDDQGGPRTLEVQSVWPRRATRQSAKVRLWCESGVRLRVAGALWRDRGVEPVKDHDVLPALVLQGDGPQLPLTLQLDEVAGSGVAALICERALIQVEVGGDHGLSCRARYLLDKVNADAVDVEFPVRAALCGPKVQLGATKIKWEPVDGNDRAIRIPLATAADARPPVLEIAYNLPPLTQEGRLFGVATLSPPVFRAPVRISGLRWQVTLPTADSLAIPITPGARPDYRWALNRWLFAPEPALAAADLEGWLLGTGRGGEPRPGSLSFWPAGPEPQRICCPSRLGWVAIVSVTLVVLFLIVYFLRLRRASLAMLLGLLVLGGLALALTWPAFLPALFYGAQPGIAAVLLVLAGIWMVQERYRRQVVFIPGFTRLKPGSSLVRTGKSSKRPRETSTIDAPAPAGVNGPEPSSAKKSEVRGS